MTCFRAFLGKELMECLRTYKALILGIVFLLFGIMNPLIAKLTPELLGMLAAEGISIEIPAPTALDSWAQFYKNIGQLGLFVYVILFSGALSNELGRGTLTPLLTKGLGRGTVILAKFAALALAWTAAYALCFLVTWGYTAYLFPAGQMQHLLLAAVCLWLFGLLLAALLLCASALTRGHYAGLLLTALAALTLMLCNIIPAARPFNPITLSQDNMALLAGTAEAGTMLSALLVTIAGIAALIWGASGVLRRRAL